MDRNIINRNNGESFQKLKRSKRAWLVPGTLWCGSGNKASNFSDLGLFEETDKCCREHDHCEQTIASFGFGYGVFNTNFFTLSHCDCDSKFRRCLHNVNDRMSNMVGYGYFNLLKMQCFEFSQRIECSERTWWGMCKHTQMSTYALLKEATDYNSTSEEVNDKLDLSIHHTVSFGDLTVTNDLVMPSDIVTKEANEKYSSVSVPERISVTVNKFQESGALEKTIDSTKTQTTDTQRVKTTDLPQTQTTDSPESETTDSVHTQTDSPMTQTTEAPKTDPTDSSIKGTTDSLRTDSPDSTISTITESAEIPQIRITDSSKPQTDSPKMETNFSKTLASGSTNLHIHPEIYTRQKEKLDLCESYKDLDTCSYQIPPLREKFGLHNAEHATLYHCNCTARLARVLAEEDEVDKVHFWLLDFVSQSCFFLPQDCTGSESCSTSFSSHDAPLIERWSKGAAVWRHLAAPRRKAKRLNSKRSKRKDSPVRLHRKCLRMHSKLHHPKTPKKEVMQTVQ
ncbi:group 3 secretory phospholipase A2 precursor [Silurus meridionalis]|nr:group 3 secretory phospholipase A2 precursor [Silurus meridionalis]